jgi:hypothetical protein
MQFEHDSVSLQDAAGRIVARPLENRIASDLVAGVGLGDRAQVGIDLPFFLWQGGASNLPASVVSGGSVPTTGIGDLALVGKATILSNNRKGLHFGFGLAAIASVSLPTGDRTSFMGEGSVSSSLRVLAEEAIGFATARASLGYALRTDTRTWRGSMGLVGAPAGGVTFGDSVPWAVAIGFSPKALIPAVDPDNRQVWELAVHGALPAGPVAPFGLGDPGASDLSPALLALDDRITLFGKRDVFLLAGVELGLNTAVGVPLVRGVLSLTWAPRNDDRDGDGIPDDADQCPELPEDKDGIQDDDGCPEDDADGDGILDEHDACPLVPGVASEDPKLNGCPAPGRQPDGRVMPGPGTPK